MNVLGLLPGHNILLWNLEFIFLLSLLAEMKLYYDLFLVTSLLYYRPSIIPGPAPDEIVLPAADSIGEFSSYCRAVFAIKLWLLCLSKPSFFC